MHNHNTDAILKLYIALIIIIAIAAACLADAARAGGEHRSYLPVVTSGEPYSSGIEWPRPTVTAVRPTVTLEGGE